MNFHNLIILCRTMIIWFALVWWIGLMISNLFWSRIYFTPCLCNFVCILQLKFCFNLDFAFLLCVFTFLSSAYKLFVEIVLAIYKWTKVEIKLNRISESNCKISKFLFVLTWFDNCYQSSPNTLQLRGINFDLPHVIENSPPIPGNQSISLATTTCF